MEETIHSDNEAIWLRILIDWMAATVGYSLEKASGHLKQAAGEYVSPSEAVPRGKAPKMQVLLLNPGDPTKQYAVIFYTGDEAFSGLLEFAEKYHVSSAHFTAIGAISGATVGWFDPQRKMYKKIPIDGQHEVMGMSGDIALYQGKPVVHTHMVVIRRNHASRTCSCRNCVSDSGGNGHG
jgi:hypothetical protein